MDDPVRAYAEQIISGDIISNEWTRLACKRHLDDLTRSLKKSSPIYFDINDALHAIDFFKFLKHSKGEWAGSSFVLEPWEQFLSGSIFGWKQTKDGYRRYRTALIMVARKNGKTTWLAGTGLYLFCADGEVGSEVYSAACKRDQARISHSEATRMVRASRALSTKIKIFKDNLNIPGTASKFEPLGADADSMDGLNVHGALIDELHANKGRNTWDVLETATGSRRQSLLIAISTAGVDQSGICYEQYEYLTRILKGTIEDDSYFGIIYSIDDDDDWQDEACWGKANPCLEVSVKIDDLRRKKLKASEIPSAQNNFLRKHMNRWTQQSNRWIDLNLWDRNNLYPIDEDDLKGRECFGGLDLSSVSDLTAWVMIFPDPSDSEIIDVLCRFWCPNAWTVSKRNKYRDQYQGWAKQGHLNVSPGNAIDYSQIKSKIVEDAQKFNIISINIDRLFQGYQLSAELTDEGMEIFSMGMGFLSMRLPMRELESRLIKLKLNHGGNPVLRFMADNLATKEDAAGNRKPDKAESHSKIDGIIGLVLALDRQMRVKVKSKSKYEDEGLFIFG